MASAAHHALNTVGAARLQPCTGCLCCSSRQASDRLPDILPDVDELHDPLTKPVSLLLLSVPDHQLAPNLAQVIRGLGSVYSR